MALYPEVSVWLVTHVSPPPCSCSNMVSLANLSNQDRELHKEAVLSAHERVENAC